MKLLDIITTPGTTIVPGAYDAVSARMIERSGFEVAYMSGAGISMSAFGYPDIGLVSFGEVLGRIDSIASSISIPLIADGDTGYGGVLNMVRTVREFERFGASGIQMEDQIFPKRCGHEAGRKVVPIKEMCDKVKAACDTRRSEDFVIIARTDSRTEHGLDEAIARGIAYRDAGADVVFLESLESEDEMRTACSSIDAPMMANMVEGGRSPLLAKAELEEIGYALAIFPNSLLRALCKTAERVFGVLKETGGTNSLLPEMYSHSELWNLMSNDQWAAYERYVIDQTEEVALPSRA